jgi:hypothetical protein
MTNHFFDTNEYMLIMDRKVVLRDRFNYLIQQSFSLIKRTMRKIFRFLDYEKTNKLRHRF